MTTDKPSENGLLARLRVSAAIKANQSDLLRWYLANYDEFGAILATVRRPGWDSIAVELNTEGLTKPNAAPITGAYARQTWWKARRARKGKPPPQTPVESTGAKSPEPPTNAASDPENPYGFRTMGGVKSPPKKED